VTLGNRHCTTSNVCNTHMQRSWSGQLLLAVVQSVGVPCAQWLAGSYWEQRTLLRHGYVDEAVQSSSAAPSSAHPRLGCTSLQVSLNGGKDWSGGAGGGAAVSHRRVRS
jgi:hypothetical protein